MHPALDRTATGFRAVPDTPGGCSLSATMWSAKTGTVSETSRKVFGARQVAQR